MLHDGSLTITNPYTGQGLRLFCRLCDLTQFIYENGKGFLFIFDLRMDSGHVTRNHNDSLHVDPHWPQILEFSGNDELTWFEEPET